MVVDVEMDVEQALPEVDGEVEVTAYEGMAMESACCSKDLNALLSAAAGMAAAAARRIGCKRVKQIARDNSESIEPIRNVANEIQLEWS